MAPKPKGKKPPQTEEKAKGLIGLKKGQKVEGAAYSVGNYKGKTLNLSKKQVAESGVKGAKAASKATLTSISDTKYEKGKGVLGKDGKAFTGRVDLGGGNIAVYVGGKRVKAAAKKPAPVTRGGGATTPKGGTGTGTGNGKGGGGKGGGRGTTLAGGQARVPLSASAAKNLGRARGQAARGSASARSQAGTIAATGRPMSTPSYTTGRRPSTTASASATKPPKEGQRQTRMVGGRKVVEVYRNGRWLPLTGSRGGY